MRIDAWETGLLIKDDKVIAHRSVRKIILNPILRFLFGKAIASIIDNEKNTFVKYVLIDQNEPHGFSTKYGAEYDYIKQP